MTDRPTSLSWPDPPPPPAVGEYASFYAGYVAAVAGAEPWQLLSAQADRLRHTVGVLDERSALSRYAPGKWSVKEVVGHLVDVERVFAYRAMRIARGDPTPLPGFDENAYVAAAGFDARPLPELVEDFATTRHATLRLFRTFGPTHWPRQGVASGSPITVRALLHIVVGHVQHHFAILHERYGIRSLPFP